MHQGEHSRLNHTRHWQGLKLNHNFTAVNHTSSKYHPEKPNGIHSKHEKSRQSHIHSKENINTTVKTGFFKKLVNSKQLYGRKDLS